MSISNAANPLQVGLPINPWGALPVIPKPGKDGRDGYSAYEIARIHGFEGTEEEWLQSLVGADGKSAYELAVENGFKGTEEEWLGSFGAGSDIVIGNGLKQTFEDGKTVLSIETTDSLDGNKSLPITAGAVETIVGNIDALLGTI